jgi:hypothetical protein
MSRREGTAPPPPAGDPLRGFVSLGRSSWLSLSVELPSSVGELTAIVLRVEPGGATVRVLPSRLREVAAELIRLAGVLGA